MLTLLQLVLLLTNHRFHSCSCSTGVENGENTKLKKDASYEIDSKSTSATLGSKRTMEAAIAVRYLDSATQPVSRDL